MQRYYHRQWRSMVLNNAIRARFPTGYYRCCSLNYYCMPRRGTTRLTTTHRPMCVDLPWYAFFYYQEMTVVDVVAWHTLRFHALQHYLAVLLAWPPILRYPRPPPPTTKQPNNVVSSVAGRAGWAG